MRAAGRDRARPRRAPGPSIRLFAILAREAPVGVIFRRGPSNHVQLIRWDRKADRFEPGQWFKGRIYEWRADLSPSGRLLIYFAAKHRGANANGTVISRPPWLTALARWPKDDAWGGGGVFLDEKTLLLNHSPKFAPQDFEHAKDVSRQSGLTIRPFDEDSTGKAMPAPGFYGKDMSSPGHHRARDGWRMAPRDEERRMGGWRRTPKEIIEKPGPEGWRLQEICHGVLRKGGPARDLTFRVLDAGGGLIADLGAADWADWDRGRLVYAQDGRLWRMKPGRPDPARATLLHDFRGAKFTPMVAPAEATRWP
ncbi:MAG: hypothetical protein ACK5MQ_15900 [Pikeienuella sp.]